MSGNRPTAGVRRRTRGAGPIPAPGVAGTSAYGVPRPPVPIDLFLDGNEGAVPPRSLLAALDGRDVDLLRRYPDARALEAALARRLGVEPSRVIVTAGADDAIDRICRAVLAPGRDLVLPVPTFEMFERYAALAGARVHRVPWLAGPYPVRAVLAAVTDRTAAVALVSPNNPTGAVARAVDLRRVARAAPGALVIADLAYAEFAAEDLTAVALDLPNVVVVRSFSKAWGLAGLRVGYAAGAPETIGWLRAAGAPYPVSRPSLALAAARLARETAAESRGRSGPLRRFVETVRRERANLADRLRRLGAEPFSSQGNFILVRFHRPDAAWVRDALAGLGIAVRLFPGRPDLAGCLRITCPGDGAAFRRLSAALASAAAPDALLFDMDGVLADVSRSYREAIRRTAAAFGARVTPSEIVAAKAEPGANNDWAVTRRLLARRGVKASLTEVTARFEALYQGRRGRPGLRAAERLIPSRALLARLASRVRLGVVTGRPRRDAERFLRETGVADLFAACVCMEDAPLKPDPAPVRLALARLGASRAWLVGDTPDDVRAARAAGVVPVGIVSPGSDRVSVAAPLFGAGAARVLSRPEELEDLLP